MTNYDIYELRQYAHAAFKRFDHARPRGRTPERALAHWFVEHAGRLGVGRLGPYDREDIEGSVGEVDRATWIALKPAVDALAGNPKPPPCALERRLAWLCRTLALGALDAILLRLAVRAALFKPFGTLAAVAGEACSSRGEISVNGLAALCGRSFDNVQERLRPMRPLRLLGLVVDGNGGDFAPSRTVLRVARLRVASDEALRTALLGGHVPAELVWDDFAHLGPIRDLTERLIGAALTRRTRGVNVLLYGAPGTGKTEFARTLAAHLSARASFVGEVDLYDGEPTRQERVAAFAVARSLAARAGRILLVVDEADEVFAGVDVADGRSRGSKVFMHRLVETTEAPTVWITNHPERLGPAVMRRMALAVELPPPGRARRRAMLERLVARRGLDLASADLDRLAAIEVAPALLDGALRVAKLTAGGAGAANLAARSVQAPMIGRAAPDPRTAERFDPHLSCADVDLDLLAERAAASRERALSFCFHGLPGTGKSAYARHLARRLGVDVIDRKASDLLSPWVGGTERAIAAAFAEAAARGAMLVIDEADSLLRDRAGARASWEVSQVNEMLTHMEAAQHPFACTTNLLESLDPATMRRFLFKVAFQPMDLAQARAAFRRFLEAEPPAGLDLLDCLTAGDFAVTARKAAVLGERDPAVLVELLAAEVAAKPGAGRRPIGFLGS